MGIGNVQKASVFCYFAFRVGYLKASQRLIVFAVVTLYMSLQAVSFAVIFIIQCLSYLLEP